MRLARTFSIMTMATLIAALPSFTPVRAATMCTDGAPITGFRGAHLGATKAQVLAAVAHDFPTLPSPSLAPSDDKSVIAYELIVPQLNPGPGFGRVAYLFDSVTDRMTAVNVLWASPASPSAAARQAIANAGVRLQSFLLNGPARGCGSDKGGAVDATSAVLYHAEDSSGSFIELVASGISLTTAQGASAPKGPALLRLTYSTKVKP